MTITHAQRPPELGGGTFSRYEVARHLGHTVETLDKVYADIPDDLLGIAGLTMDEIIRRARREVWGPIPGDADYEEILYATAEVSESTGIKVKTLGARVARGEVCTAWRLVVIRAFLCQEPLHDEAARSLR